MPKITRDPSIDIYIARQVRIFRLALKMSQNTLAKRLGVSSQQVQKYERGDNRISASRLFHITLILNQDIETFYPQTRH